MSHEFGGGQVMNQFPRIAIMDRPVEKSQADCDLERRVMSYLAARHVPGLRTLSVQARDGVVTVSGRVLTFYEKQLCNQCVRRVAGVMELINAVDVAHDPTPMTA
jgi:osmotically-inducible protein OsmY